MTSRRGPVEKCTFCGKSRQHVESLIAGPPGINICNECVELCNTILLEEMRRSGGAGSGTKRAREGARGGSDLVDPFDSCLHHSLPGRHADCLRMSRGRSWRLEFPTVFR